MTSEADRIIDLYERHAADWARDRGTKLIIEKAWIERFCEQLRSNATILDLGCGSGEPVTRYFIENGYVITGVDSSPALIDICKTRFPDNEWIVADMRALALDRQFDGILAWDSFFHLCPDDQHKMFPIFKRHSARNAALMFTSGPSDGEVIANYRGEPLYHGSLDQAEYRSLLNEYGFQVISHVVEDPTCGRHTIWLAHRSHSE